MNKGAELSGDSTLTCFGKNFKCINATHYQRCSFTARAGQFAVMSLSGVPEKCLNDRYCDTQSAIPCDGTLQSYSNASNIVVSTETSVKPTRRPIRLINGYRSKNWRPHVNFKTEAEREAYKAKLIAERQDHEKFIDSLLAKKGPGLKQVATKQQDGKYNFSYLFDVNTK